MFISVDLCTYVWTETCFIPLNKIQLYQTAPIHLMCQQKIPTVENHKLSFANYALEKYTPPQINKIKKT